MQSRNKPKQKAHERIHAARVAELPCSVCDQAGPSEVHEIKQGLWMCAVALCSDCHRGSKNGLHGDKDMWRLYKMDEIDALSVTLRRLM